MKWANKHVKMVFGCLSIVFPVLLVDIFFFIDSYKWIIVLEKSLIFDLHVLRLLRYEVVIIQIILI